MKVELQELNEVEKILKIEVPSERVKEIMEEVTSQIKKKAKIKGFREGKVPLYLVKRLFREQIYEKSIEKIIENTLNQAIRETQVEPLLRPRIEEFGELKEGEPFIYSVLVEIRPSFELKREDYIGVEVEKEPDIVKEEEVDRMLEEIRYSFSELKRVKNEEVIKERDVVVIKFCAYDGENLIPGHQAEALFIDVGTGEFNEKIEKELLNKKEGDKFSIEVEYPEEGLNPLLAGKKVKYEIEIKEVYKRELPELNEDFIKKLNIGYENMENLKESIKNRLLEEKKRKNESKLKEKILSKILEKVDFKVPNRYVELKFNQLLEQIKQNLERDGFSFEKLNISIEKLKDRLYPVAERQAKEEILLEKIADMEDITIPQEEIDKTVEAISKGLNVSLEHARGIVYFNIIPKKLAEKTLKFLIENAKLFIKES